MNLNISYKAVEAKKKAEASKKQLQQDDRNFRATDVITNGYQGAPIVNGKAKEQEGQIAGLNLSALGYGQGLGQVGEDIQRVKQLQRDRTDKAASDPVTALMMGQKAGQSANAQRNMADSGVKGGAAARSIASIDRAANAEIAASAYGQQADALGAERTLASNMLSGTVSNMQAMGGKNVQAPTQDKSGSSFICTKLRSKGLMTGKESLIMTQFMLKSLITRADFLVWYFRHGKAAVERAEASGYDWATVKNTFVDDIIALLKKGKITQAQDWYILQTGIFCTQFGAKGFERKLATKRFVAMFNFPRLFFIDNCNTWLKTNFRSIPKILKAELV